MTCERILGGLRVLVVEDEFLIGAETCNVLRRAGAHIVGMFNSEAPAIEAIKTREPDAVVLDLNLGNGPSFAIADFLVRNDIPFVFATGYDQAIIPDRFRDVQRLEKPFELNGMVSAVSRLWPRGCIG